MATYCHGLPISTQYPGSCVGRVMDESREEGRDLRNVIFRLNLFLQTRVSGFLFH